MAEKRRGLGRGLGSLIPSQETGRPSDVFFPRGERAEDVAQEQASAEAAPATSSDPAESMRRAQASRRSSTSKSSTRSTTQKAGATKTGTTKTGTTKSTSTKSSTSGSSSRAATGSASTTKASSTRSGAAKTTAAKQTASKSTSAAKATPAKSTPSKTSAPKASGSATKPAARAAGKSAPTAAEPAAAIEQSTNPASHDATTVDTAAIETHSQSGSIDASNTHDTSNAARSADASISSAVDDAVDETRDGIYVSRETVRTHPSDRAVPEDESAQQPVGDASATDVDPVDEVTPGIDAAHADRDVEDLMDATDDVGEDELVPVPGTTFGEIDLDLIRPNPRQPRDVFDEDALDELVTSIREIGVLQPVVVRRRPDLPGHYELIMGERRYRASKEAGRTTIPAIVRATADDDLLRDALLENLHRVDLNPLEEAAAYAQLLEDFNCTQEELSERIGRSRPQISNTIRLLKLPAMVQRRVAAGVLSSGHARALLGLNDGADMEQLAQRVVAEGLSVRATEEAVILLNRGDRIAVSRGTREADPELAELARNLGDRLETRVNVVMGKRKGKLSVEFANGEDLARILSLLGLDASEQ